MMSARSVALAWLAFATRFVVAAACMCVVLIGTYSLIGITQRSTLPQTPAAVTPVDAFWRSVWSAMGLYDYSRTQESVGHSAPINKVAAIPPRLRTLHYWCVDVSCIVPAFIVHLLVYYGLTRRYVWPRCARCRGLLHSLEAARCPACGSEF